MSDRAEREDGGRQVTVLLLDDTRSGRRVLAHLVRRAGCVPVVAGGMADARAALAARRATEPEPVDAVVTDLFLGDGVHAGHTTVLALRELVGPQVPILAVTSYPLSPEIDRAALAAADVKVLSWDAIVDLEEWLDALVRLPRQSAPLVSDETLRRLARLASLIGAALAAVGAAVLALAQRDWSVFGRLLGGGQ